jgi:hypothetical protein
LGDQLYRRPGAEFGRDAVALREAMFDPEKTSCAARAGWQRSSPTMDANGLSLLRTKPCVQSLGSGAGSDPGQPAALPVPQSDLKGPSYLP